MRQSDLAVEAVDHYLKLSQNSFDAIDVRQRKEGLRLKTSILRSLGRHPEADAVQVQTTEVPLRDPNMDPGLIDLTDYYYQSLFQEEAPAADSQHYWRERLPETFDPGGELSFDLRGRIVLNSGVYTKGELIGETVNSGKNHQYPSQVEGIKIDRQCKAIHFVQGCRWGWEQPGVTVATYKIHYRNGHTENLPVIYGKHVIDHWIHRFTPEVLSGIEKFIWKQSFKLGAEKGTLALTLQSWTNPHPELTISHLDFVSEEKMAVPFLVGITLE